MKKLLLLLLCVPLLGLGQIEFKHNTCNFGEIFQGDTIEENFKFRNNGANSITINNVKCRCEGIISDWPRVPINPGEMGIINIKYNTTKERGTQNKLIKVSAIISKNSDPVRIDDLRLQAEIIVPDIQVKLIRSMYLECLSLEKKNNKENCDSIVFSEYEFDVGGIDTKYSQDRGRIVKECYFGKGYSTITYIESNLWDYLKAKFYFKHNHLYFAHIISQDFLSDDAADLSEFAESDPSEYYFYNDMLFNNNLLSFERSSNLVNLGKNNYNKSNYTEYSIQETLNKAQAYLIKYGNKSIVFEGSFEYDPENISEVTVSIKENFGIETVVLNSVCDLIKEKERVNNILVERYNTNGSFTVSEIESIINLKDYFNMFEKQMLSNTYYDKNIPNKENCTVFKRAIERYNQFSNLRPFLISIF